MLYQLYWTLKNLKYPKIAKKKSYFWDKKAKIKICPIYPMWRHIRNWSLTSIWMISAIKLHLPKMARFINFHYFLPQTNMIMLHQFFEKNHFILYLWIRLYYSIPNMADLGGGVRMRRSPGVKFRSRALIWYKVCQNWPNGSKVINIFCQHF